MSHDIQVISNLYITFDNLFELITKIRFPNNSFKFINQITINIGSDMPCCRRVFKPMLYFDFIS